LQELNTFGRILKANLSQTRKKSNSSDAKKLFVFISFCFALKAGFRVLKFEFCQIKYVRTKDKLAITVKILLKLDSNSSLLLEYGSLS